MRRVGVRVGGSSTKLKITSTSAVAVCINVQQRLAAAAASRTSSDILTCLWHVAQQKTATERNTISMYQPTRNNLQVSYQASISIHQPVPQASVKSVQLTHLQQQKLQAWAASTYLPVKYIHVYVVLTHTGINTPDGPYYAVYLVGVLLLPSRTLFFLFV